MGHDGSIKVGENLLLISIQQVESYFIRIRLYSVGEKLSVEGRIRQLNVLQGQSESPRQNENFQNFLRHCKLLM